MTYRLAVATGDPAGVGPEVSLLAARTVAARAELLLFGDGARLSARAGVLGLACDVFADAASVRMTAGRIAVVHTGDVAQGVIDAHDATAEGGAAQLRALDGAAAAVQAGHAAAVVTAPTSKLAITRSGTPFVGQTEHLARRAGLRDDDVSMLFLGPRLRVGLATTHLSVRDAASAVTEARVMRTARHLRAALAAYFPGEKPLRLAVTGLNPHAGEGGMFGVEDRDVITPAVGKLRGEPGFASGAVELSGPVPAESAFRYAVDGRFHGVVTMLHDQATIACKLVDWGKSVNVTWGLPFLRTSVDHGVAYDAARAAVADAEGMEAAMEMALRLLEGAVGQGSAT